MDRGHDVHAISYYQPSRKLPGTTLHVLKNGSSAMGTPGPVAGAGRRLPPWVLRLLNAWRFKRAGLAELVHGLAPDVFQAHFVVEHGFFGALTGYHPYVVNAWGSDLYQAPKSLSGAMIARFVLRRTDLLSANDPALARQAIRLGMADGKVMVARLGLDREWFQEPSHSVNLSPDASPPVVFSDRALEPLYNIDTVIRAFARVRERVPGAVLRIAGDGSRRAALERMAKELSLGASVQFLGHVGQGELRQKLAESHVYVSVPTSDSLSLSTMEAMARGAFPVVSNLESQDGWITHPVNGLRAPVRDVEALAGCLELALTDFDLRRRAVEVNRTKVEADGDLEKNVVALERRFYALSNKGEGGWN